MKIEISYKNSLIGSLSAGESLALHLNGQKLTEDLVVRAVSSKLSAPTIALDGTILRITDTNDVSVNYHLWLNGEVVYTSSADPTAIDISALLDEAGTYSIYLTAVAEGYEESAPSNTVEYVVSGATTTPPDDLTGYTVTVPANWSVTSGYLLLSPTLNSPWFEFDGVGFMGLGLGYDISFTSPDDPPSLSLSSNSVALNNSAGIWNSSFSSSAMLTFYFLDDSTASSLGYYSNSSLIQWFVDNKATFTKTA